MDYDENKTHSENAHNRGLHTGPWQPATGRDPIKTSKNALGMGGYDMGASGAAGGSYGSGATEG